MSPGGRANMTIMKTTQSLKVSRQWTWMVVKVLMQS